MDKKHLKSFVMITLYICALVLMVVNFKSVLSAMEILLKVFEPFFFGIVVAFLFNQPCIL